MPSLWDIPLPAGSVTVVQRLQYATSGMGVGLTPALPTVPPVPALYPQPGFNLAGIFATFWSGYVFPQYNDTVYWLPVVNEETSGATPTASYDVNRAQPTSYTDGSFGVGWQAVDPITGASRKGYFAARHLPCAFNDVVQTQRRDPAGRIEYSRAVLYWLPPTLLKKGDLIVRADGRRYVVADEVTPGQAWGTTLVYYTVLEARSTKDITYTVPLT